MKQLNISARFFILLLASGLLLACANENNDNNKEDDGNQPPTISGTPATTVNENSPYHFAPTAADGDSGDSLTFSISNNPPWANFNSQTGILSGTPDLNDAGDYDNIIISVSDGNASAQLSAFTISVIDVSPALVVSTHNPTTQAAGTALHSNITITFNAPLDAATVTGTSVTLRGAGNTAITTMLSTNNQTITIDPASDLEPLTTYAVTVTTAVTSTNGAALDSDYSWNFTTLAGSSIPGIAQWEANMLSAGKSWGQFLTDLNPAPGTYNEINTNYYDGQRVYFQIADYTGQEEPWNTYAQEAERIYMNYLVTHDFGMPGYRRFAEGIYMDYVRTGDNIAYENIVKIRDNPAFSNAGTRRISTPAWYRERSSREIAYALEAHIFAERVDHPRDEADVARYVTMALNHINEWITGEFSDPDRHRRAPFMFGLTAEALIMFYEWELDNGRDPTALYNHASVPTEFVPTMTIPEAIKAMADYLYDEAVVESGDNMGKPMWVADLGGTRGNWNDSGGTGYAAFRYEDINKGEPAPDLNLLIAPAYAWLFLHYGEMKYITIADQLFVSGVNLPNLNRNTKIFNQNYRWSFDYIKWRNEGFAKWN